MFHVKHSAPTRHPALLRHRFNPARSVDINQQLPWTLLHAESARGTLGVINRREIILHGNCPGRTIFLTQPAADTADGTHRFCRRPLILIGAGDQNIRRIGDVGDHVPGADFGALHTVGAFVLIHLGHAIIIDKNSAKLARLNAGAKAQAAVSALQCAVAGYLHSGDAVVKAHIALEFMAGAAAAGTADKGGPALLGPDLYTHCRCNTAGLQAGAAGTGVDGSLAGEDCRRASRAAGIAAASAVGAGQTVQDQFQFGVALYFKDL